MEPRLMPLVTFRCAECGTQETLTAKRYTRRAGEEDAVSPHPRHHHRPMEIVQVDHYGRPG